MGISILITNGMGCSVASGKSLTKAFCHLLHFFFFLIHLTFASRFSGCHGCQFITMHGCLGARIFEKVIINIVG